MAFFTHRSLPDQQFAMDTLYEEGERTCPVSFDRITSLSQSSRPLLTPAADSSIYKESRARSSTPRVVATLRRDP
jgi:hypothetical protein